MAISKRSDLRPGLAVYIVTKADQPTGKLSFGHVACLLTSKPEHSRGIKVRLTNGLVGRVQALADQAPAAPGAGPGELPAELRCLWDD